MLIDRSDFILSSKRFDIYARYFGDSDAQEKSIAYNIFDFCKIVQIPLTISLWFRLMFEILILISFLHLLEMVFMMSHIMSRVNPPLSKMLEKVKSTKPGRSLVKTLSDLGPN